MASLGPLADLLDQYASLCNEVISLFAHLILRLIETINNIGSPLEVFASSCSLLLTLLYTTVYLFIHEIIYLVIWPFRSLLTVLISHPLVMTVISLFSIMICAAFIIIIKQISVVQVGNDLIRLIAPNCRYLVHTVFHHLSPLIVAVLHSLLFPVKLLYHMFVSVIELIPVSRSKRQRIHSSNCGADDINRITCCVCFMHEKSILLQPCNHICLCADCVEELLETYEEPSCPLCRCIITSYIDVYI